MLYTITSNGKKNQSKNIDEKAGTSPNKINKDNGNNNIDGSNDGTTSRIY